MPGAWALPITHQGCLLSVGLTQLMAAPHCTVASYWGHPPGSQPPTAVTQDISEHTLAHAKFKNENASLGSCPVFANCQVTGFGLEALCHAQGGWRNSGTQSGHLTSAIAAERLRVFISQGLL